MAVMLAAARPGDSRTSPHGGWLLEEDFGASDSQDESGGKNNLVIQSVLFFCTISWTPLT